MKQSDTTKKLVAGLALLILTVVIVGGIVIVPKKSAVANPVSIMKNSTPSVTSASAQFTNGTYTATGSYDSPGGTEFVKVTLTLDNDTVTAANVISGANDPTAATYQTSFIGGYMSQVVGKHIASIKLRNVSGSSLTPIGFNNAVKKIEQQAKA
jgi:membrane-bound inhibitor of C-type lysozyme